MMASLRYLLHSVVAVSLLALVQAEIVAELKSQFKQTLHWGGMEYGLCLQFSPNTDHVFIAEKNGRIRIYNNIDVGPGDYAFLLDLSKQTYILHDRGMLGMAIHPEFPKVPYIFALYSVNLDPVTQSIIWNPPNQCPTINDGYCTTPGHLIRIKVDLRRKKGEIDQVLIDDFCGSSYSHHVDDLKFASDGSLFISAGDGAPFDRADIGLKDPCSDPKKTGPQGSFRSQFEDTNMGKIMRIKPDALLANRKLVRGSDYKAILKGARNPYRMTFRPETGDIWFGDVGSDYVEELNMVPNPLKNLDAPLLNYGWPCYEGVSPMPLFAGYNFPICQELPLSSTVLPQFSYKHHVPMPLTDSYADKCTSVAASPSGLLFFNAPGLPEKWNNTLFMLESSKRCVFYFGKTPNGDPDMNDLKTLLWTPDSDGPEEKEGQYVDIQQSPDGDIYIMDLYYGKLFKIAYNFPPGKAPPKKRRAYEEDYSSSLSSSPLPYLTTLLAVFALLLM